MQSRNLFYSETVFLLSIKVLNLVKPAVGRVSIIEASREGVAVVLPWGDSLLDEYLTVRDLHLK